MHPRPLPTGLAIIQALMEIEMNLAEYDRWRTFPDKMTPEEAEAALAPLAHVGDLEVAHAQADDILCALLRYLGHDTVVDAWHRVDKWYA